MDLKAFLITIIALLRVTEAAFGQVHIMSLNLRTSIANDPCPSGCWGQRRDRVRRLLEKYNPDFIGTQEGAPDQTDYLRSLGWAMFGECAGDCTWNERPAIFYNPLTWTYINGYTFALSDTPESLGSNGWGLEYLRVATVARFLDIGSGSVVCLLNTHYDVSRGHDKSSVLVADRLEDICATTDAVFMTGDLNAPPEEGSIRYLRGEYMYNGRYTPIPLYQSLTAAGAGGPTYIGGSYGNRPTGSKLDYVLARDDQNSCLLGGGIITDTFDGYSVSDHAVVHSTFCLGAWCSGCIR